MVGHRRYAVNMCSGYCQGTIFDLNKIDEMTLSVDLFLYVA